MKLRTFQIGPTNSGLRWLQWVAILLAVGLFAVLSLIVSVLFPAVGHRGEQALIWINGIAAVLAILIAPYLLRSFERMQTRSERQNHELRTLHAIDKAINAQVKIETIGEIAITEAIRATDAEAGVFVLWREGRASQIEERVISGFSDAMLSMLGGLLDERLRDVSKSGKLELCHDLDQTWQTDRLNSSLKLRNSVCVPVAFQDQPVGLLMLFNRGGALMPGQGFSAEDVALLEAVAASIGVAVQNARFVRETRRRGEMLRALVAHTGEAIADSSDTPRLMQIFADSASRILDCPRVSVYFHDEDNDLFKPLAAVDNRTGHGEDMTARFADQPLPASFTLLGLRSDGRADTEPHIYSQMQKALLLGDGSGDFLDGYGVAYLLMSRDRHCQGLLVYGDLPTGQEVADFAQALASQASVTLENAVLFADISHHYQREKRIAEKLQQNLLPDIPNRAGDFEFAQEYRAALSEAEIGGDFLDLFSLGQSRVGIVMADVSGKGLGAAVQTAAVKYTLRAFAHHHPTAPGRVLSLVNDVLCSDMNNRDGFITLFYGSLDTKTGELVWSCAGHEPPLLSQSPNGTILALDSSDGMVLGCLAGSSYEDHVTFLGREDTLLLYTDGVTESRDGEGEFLGQDGLRRILPPAGLDAPAALARICTRLREFSGDAQRDDVAMLLVRRLPEPAILSVSVPQHSTHPLAVSAA